MDTRNNIYFLGVIAGIVALLLGHSTMAAESKIYDFEIIMDASLGMNGEYPGGKKMQAAREAIKEVIVNVPEGSYMGLRVFGDQFSTSEQNYSDSRNVIPIGPLKDKENFKAKVDSIVPRGLACSDYAVRQAAADFTGGAEYGKAIFLIVNDPKDECGGNLAQAIRDLKGLGFDGKVYVLSFTELSGAREQESNELYLAARSTDGTYPNYTGISSRHLSDDITSRMRNLMPDFPLPKEFTQATPAERGIIEGEIKTGERKCYKMDLKKGEDFVVKGIFLPEGCNSGNSDYESNTVVCGGIDNEPPGGFTYDCESGCGGEYISFSTNYEKDTLRSKAEKDGTYFYCFSSENTSSNSDQMYSKTVSYKLKIGDGPGDVSFVSAGTTEKLGGVAAVNKRTGRYWNWLIWVLSAIPFLIAVCIALWLIFRRKSETVAEPMSDNSNIPTQNQPDASLISPSDENSKPTV